jgi:hypothetical protein
VPRVSQYFHLRRSQPSLDFVDVDVVGDVRLYIDPLSLRTLSDDWAAECVALIQDFFGTVIGAIRSGDDGVATDLLKRLREPNETHLGLSRGPARGRGVGLTSATQLTAALGRSEAVKSGLLKDLEETILMVEGVNHDIISDMTTNIIREPLINYTKGVCSQYGIPITPNVYPGPMWDPATKNWKVQYADLPMPNGRPLILIPKAIVRRKFHYNEDEYFRYFILPYLAESEISVQSELVHLLADGRTPRVNKKDLINKFGKGKRLITRITLEHPEILQRYRDAKMSEAQDLPGHDQLARLTHTQSPAWDRLLRAVTTCPKGKLGEDEFHRNVEKLLSTAFWPSLTGPQIEYQIHEGRKRIDIAYVNQANHGFFKWLAQHYRAPHVFVECKNYSADPANPELDQLSGRFSQHRGQFGILVCRNFENKDLFLTRCRDTALDGRGFVIAIDDTDLEELIKASKAAEPNNQFILLKERFDRLV